MNKFLLLLIATSSCASLMGMENQITPLNAPPSSTLQTAASLHILNSRITSASSVSSAARMEDQAPARRLRAPKVSCPPCDCDCMQESCVCAWFPLILTQAAIMDATVCALLPCFYGAFNVCCPEEGVTMRDLICPYSERECGFYPILIDHCLGTYGCSCSGCIE